MKTAHFLESGEIRVVDAAPPRPGPGQVVLEVRSAGICGSDLHYLHGKNPWGSPLTWPRRAGHELAGAIVEVGQGVTHLRAGDRVGVEPTHLAACGRCTTCASGHSHVCPQRGLVDGQRWSSAGFSELDVALASHVHRLPDAVSFDQGALADVYACGVHALHRVEERRLARVAIVGSGAIALTLGQLAKARGAGCVIVVGRREEAVRHARDAGAADLTIASTDAAEVAERVREATGGVGADVVFETVGHDGAGLAVAVACAAPRASVVILGAFWDEVRLGYALANRKELDVRFSNSYGTWEGEREFALALAALAGGALDTARIVTHHVALGRIRDGFDAALDKRRSGAVKVMVHPTAEGERVAAS